MSQLTLMRGKSGYPIDLGVVLRIRMYYAHIIFCYYEYDYIFTNMIRQIWWYPIIYIIIIALDRRLYL
jgi:hypothetical protein